MNNKKHMEDILYYFEKYHYENMILDDNEAKFIHDYIINLQSKIDKAIEILGQYKHLSSPTEEQPKETKELFEGTMEQLNNLSILKEDK
jgi:hypothetical protein